MRSLVQLRIDELILHEVPRARRGDDEADPIALSDASVDLTDEHRRYLQERFRADLGGNAREVIEDADAATPVPGDIKGLLHDPDVDLVSASQEMAKQLREVQTGISPSGLLMVARCSWGTAEAILVAKVELEQGVRAQQVTRDGNVTYDMELIRDLVFGETSRIYKAGLFSAEDIQSDSDPLRGIAIDRQKGGPSVTQFFLYEYLGCEYLADAAENTRRFYEAARTHINAAVSDAETKARYIVALAAEVGNNRVELDPRRFARENLDVDDRSGFLDALGRAGSPTVKFQKDAEYVSTQIMRYETENHIVVVADREQVDEGMVEVGDDDLTIHDRVSKVQTQGRRGPRPDSRRKGNADNG
jgi:hypothetical protein